MTPSDKTLVHKMQPEGAYPVELHKTGEYTFAVIYGAERHTGLSYHAAAHEFGECLMHALSCAGAFEKSQLPIHARRPT